MCRASLVSPEQSVLSSGLPPEVLPEEAPVTMAEKCTFLVSFLSIWC